MSGLSRPLLLAVGCLAALCVITAARNTTVAPNVSTPSSPPPTTATVPVSPTTLTPPPVTTPAPGGRRPNGLSALARPPVGPSRPPCVWCAGPGRAAVRQHGGPSESGWGRAEVAAVAECPGWKGWWSLGGLGLFADPTVFRSEVLFKSAS